MKRMSRTLLSICIPTYNRAEVLAGTLGKLLTDPDFDPQKVEVLVSDNASPDNTAEVVARYPVVKYRRNDENLGYARNFGAVFAMAKGDYVRMMNDTASLKPGMLKKMLDTVEAERGSGRNLLMVQNSFVHKNDTVRFVGAKGLVSQLSYFTTWSTNTGMWREDFEQLTNLYANEQTLFSQTDWLLTIADNGRETTMVSADFMDIVDQKNKGNYNLFDIFINKYLWLLRQHDIKGCVLEREKFRLLRHFVLPWRKTAREYKFEIANAGKIILKNYWYEPYLLPLLVGKWAWDKIKT